MTIACKLCGSHNPVPGTILPDEGIQTVLDLAAELRLKADHADFDKKRRLIEALI